MQPTYPYDDVPGVDNIDCLMSDPFGQDLGYPFYQPAWYSLDPNLGSIQHYYDYDNIQPQKSSMHLNQRCFSAYDPDAHGFVLSQYPPRSDPGGYYFNVDMAWHGEQDRHVRYVSPTASGASISECDSAMSEYTLSPDGLRNSQILPTMASAQNPLASPVNEFLHSFVQSYTPQPMSTPPSHHPLLGSQACSMKELQYTPDTQTDEDLFSEIEVVKGKVQIPEELELSENVSPADSGLGQSIDDDNNCKDEGQNDEGSDDGISVQEESDVDSEFKPSRSPTTRLPLRTSLRSPRHKTSLSNSTVLDPASRVQKRKMSSTQKKSRSKSRLTNSNSVSREGSTTSRGNNRHARSFPCTFHHYGCNAEFASKNEWKRHVASQHLQLGFFRCDMGTCRPAHSSKDGTRIFNDFNRKDLFTQHCRRMHAPWGSKDIKNVPKRDVDAFETQMEEIRSRCWNVRRQAPTHATCGICNKKFVDKTENSKAWEDRMEHVGRHYERDFATKENEKVDEGLREWSVREGLLRKGRGGKLWLLGMEPADDTAQKSNVGRRSGRRTVPKVTVREEQSQNDDDEDGDDTDSQSSITAHEQRVNPTMMDDEDDSDTDAEGEDE